ncbi:MAG TPA: rod shape-determining protein MreC [Candidatus Limnocylindrales bacterium]|nr:rod shape-determining protein MreC [Candidatus Limnocylindrales bacterium]
MATLGRARGGTRGVARPFALLFLISVSLLLFRQADPVRATTAFLTGALVPVQYVLAETGVTTSRFFQAIGEIERMRAENARLRGQVDRLTIDNVRLRERAVAEEQIGALDAVQRGLPFESVIAPVIARDPSGIVQSLVLGVGSDDGVTVGHVVVSDQGVVGLVSEVGPGFSKVLLVTDTASSVSAIVQGSRATGIVHGQFGDAMVMEWILQGESVQPGDIVITAGLALGEDLRSPYPKGLVLGRVVDVTRSENAAYQRAIVAPAVDLGQLEFAVVVKTER